jgi:glycosyltransferase involved in cell wall biosynthesis
VIIPKPFQLNPIKLVYIIGTYPGLTTTFIDREINALRRMGGFEIQIVSIRTPMNLDACSPEQQAFNLETVHLIPPRWVDFDFLAFIAANIYFMLSRPLVYFNTLIYLLAQQYPDIHSWLMSIIHFWEGVWAAYRLRGKDFDHLHAHFMDRATLVALVVGRFLNKSYSVTAHANDIYVEAVLVHAKMVNARFVVTVSEFNKKQLLKDVPDIEHDKIHVLHPWVELSNFSPPTYRPINTRLHILSVGRLVEKKGHIDLIEACHLLCEQGCDLECRIIGEGPLRSFLEELIVKYGLQDRIHLMGGLPQSIVKEYLGEWADLFSLPCVVAKNGDRDGMPVSLAEAMAMELPVISTDIVGIHELVQPGTGILVPPHSPENLAEAIRTISTWSQSTRIEMGRRGRAVITNGFNVADEIRKLADLFRYTVAGDIFIEKQQDLQSFADH